MNLGASPPPQTALYPQGGWGPPPAINKTAGPEPASETSPMSPPNRPSPLYDSSGGAGTPGDALDEQSGLNLLPELLTGIAAGQVTQGALGNTLC